MMYLAVLSAALILVLTFGVSLAFFLSCIFEREHRAAIVGGGQVLGALILLAFLVYLAASDFFHKPWALFLLVLFDVACVLGAWLLFRKTASNPRALRGAAGLIHGEVKRTDERGIVFARKNFLAPGSEAYRTFYREHPDFESSDARRRTLGGPLDGTIDRPYESLNRAAAFASQQLTGFLAVNPAIKPKAHTKMKDLRIDLSPDQASAGIKGYARHLGADLVGIAEINPLWCYSHRGMIKRGNEDDWGREIAVNHRFAVVIATEMAFETVVSSPRTPNTVESIFGYAKGAFVATQLAAYISNIGYSATTNINQHYEALMVPLAVDAGLGELGRMGYLITREFGPRIRLAAVTTDLPLLPDKPVDIGVEDFCRICKKCAVCCPSRSIPSGDQAVVNGTLRWKLNAETCYEYWGKAGTDCNVCMRVCPWSHARTIPHQLIVYMVSRNAWARRLFTIMDDLYYGRKPKHRAGPAWAEIKAPAKRESATPE